MFTRIKTAITDRTNRNGREGLDELEDYKKEPDDLPGYSESSGSEMAREQVLESDSSRRDSVGSLESFKNAVLVTSLGQPNDSLSKTPHNGPSKTWFFSQYGQCYS